MQEFIVTARKRSLGQGNIFTPVCHSVHRGEVPGPGRGCLVLRGAWSQEGGLLWEGAWSWGVPGPGRGVCSGGVPGPGGAWSQEGACSWGCLVLEGVCSRRVSGPRGAPGGDPRMATAVGGTHLTGMHSCLPC